MSNGDNYIALLFAALPPVIGFFPDVPVLKSPSPSIGKPWPMPQSLSLYRDYSYYFSGHDFQFVLTGYTCDILQEAIKRYSSYVSLMFSQDIKSNRTEHDWFTKLHINVSNPCGGYPYYGMDESCK